MLPAAHAPVWLHTPALVPPAGGLPNAVSAAMTQAMAEWTPNNLNDGNLVAVYLVNVAFCLVGSAVFYLVGGARGASPSGDKNSGAVRGTFTGDYTFDAGKAGAEKGLV